MMEREACHNHPQMKSKISILMRLWLVAVLVFVCFCLRVLLVTDADDSERLVLPEVNDFLDLWRIDVVSNDGLLNVETPGTTGVVSSERTSGLKRRWLDGVAVRGLTKGVDVEITPTVDGTVTCFIRGEYRFKEGHSLPQLVDIVAAKVDGSAVVEERLSVDYRNAKRIDIQAKAGRRILLSVQFMPHVYSEEEVRILLAKWFGVKNVPAQAILFCRRNQIGGFRYWIITNRAIVIVVVGLFLVWLGIGLFMKSGRWKIIYLSMLALLMVMPLLLCNNQTHSIVEKRKLATTPQLMQDKKLNSRFPKEVEQWFGDHIGFRNIAIEAYKWINKRVNSIVSMGQGRWNRRTGWVFRVGGVPKRSVDPHGIEALTQYRDWLYERGVSLYLVIVPDKERVYSCEADTVGVGLSCDGLSDWREALEGVLGNRLILPLDALKSGKTTSYVYFKTSHHWSQFGAFLAWRKLGEAMHENGDVTDLSGFSSSAYTVERSRFVREDFAMNDSLGITATRYFGLGLSGAPSNMLNVEYLYYSPATTKFTKVNYLHDDYHCGFDFSGAGGNETRVCVLGNSHSDQLDPFLGSSFQHARRVRYNAIGLYKGDPIEQSKLKKNFAKDVLDYRADVVVLVLAEADLSRVRNLMMGE